MVTHRIVYKTLNIGQHQARLVTCMGRSILLMPYCIIHIWGLSESACRRNNRAAYKLSYIARAMSCVRTGLILSPNFGLGCFVCVSPPVMRLAFGQPPFIFPRPPLSANKLVAKFTPLTTLILHSFHAHESILCQLASQPS